LPLQARITPSAITEPGTENGSMPRNSSSPLPRTFILTITYEMITPANIVITAAVKPRLMLFQIASRVRSHSNRM